MLAPCAPSFNNIWIAVDITTSIIVIERIDVVMSLRGMNCCCMV